MPAALGAGTEGLSGAGAGPDLRRLPAADLSAATWQPGGAAVLGRVGSPQLE